MKRYGWIPALLLLVALGCESPPDNRKLLDQFVVTTNFDTEADFSSYATYAIPTDTIGFFTNTNPNDTIMLQTEVDFPRPVLEKIVSNMNGRGYTRVGRNENPDLGVKVTLVNDYNVFQQVVYPNYYYGGYYGYGGYYSYPYVNTYAYNTGVLIIEILDLKNKTAQNKVKVIWNAYLGDVYSAYDAVTQSEEAIDQSFTQSPYLEK